MSAQQDLKQEFYALRDAVLDFCQRKEPFPNPKKMWKDLIRLEHADWALEWEQTRILYYCHRRIEHPKAHKRLRELRTAYADKGMSAQFDEFHEVIKTMLHPLSLTPHGYKKTFSKLPADNIFTALDDVLSPLFALDKPVILYAGALLGYIREGKLIDHDDDIDVAIYLGESAMVDVPAKWHAYKKALHADNHIDPEYVDHPSPIFKLANNLGIDIDLFPCWSFEGRFTVHPYSFKAMPVSDIMPLTPFKDTRLMLPNNPEALLKQSYGENWRVPDPMFHFPWFWAKKRFHVLYDHSFAL